MTGIARGPCSRSNGPCNAVSTRFTATALTCADLCCCCFQKSLAVTGAPCSCLLCCQHTKPPSSRATSDPTNEHP